VHGVGGGGEEETIPSRIEKKQIPSRIEKK
jgi:hypothetical protein